VLGGLAILSGEGSHRRHVHQAVGNVTGHSCDGGLPLIDECLAATDKRRDDQPSDHDQAKKYDEEERVIAPEDHRRERQRQDVGDAIEYQTSPWGALHDAAASASPPECAVWAARMVQ
jgi:hypothetical protein